MLNRFREDVKELSLWRWKKEYKILRPEREIMVIYKFVHVYFTSTSGTVMIHINNI